MVRMTRNSIYVNHSSSLRSGEAAPFPWPSVVLVDDHPDRLHNSSVVLEREAAAVVRCRSRQVVLHTLAGCLDM